MVGDIIPDSRATSPAISNLLEQDVDIRVIQTLLGHAKLDTTALYTRVANTTIRAVTSPLDRLASLIEERPRPEA
jgi:integrase/recombinase XerD